jgi:hypothetical protein
MKQNYTVSPVPMLENVILDVDVAQSWSRPDAAVAADRLPS